jgi:hypothetical protein
LVFHSPFPHPLQLDPVRLIEAHYHCLILVFGVWLEAAPFLDSDRPSEAELEQFYEDEKKHGTKVSIRPYASRGMPVSLSQLMICLPSIAFQREGLEALASRLASTLGVGKLSNAANEPVLERFMLKCIAFAFDQEDSNDDNPGERLAFLTLASK